MRLLFALAVGLAVMAGLVIAIVMAGAVIARSTEAVLTRDSLQRGAIPKVAFALLWLLVAGISAGLIGGA